MYLGLGNEEIHQVVYEHGQNLTHVHQDFDTLSWCYLAHKLVDLAPQGLDRVSFTVGAGQRSRRG